ncbi:MAG: sorbosone dehydrogenase family protein, partial [Bacteroidota bacterium]
DLHFGYPYCHQGDTPDPEFGSKRNCTEFTAPIQKITPHAAPLGLEFYRPGNFPARFADCVFIAEHGSWNREKKSGYRVTMVRLQDGKAVSYEPFAEGWLLPEDEVWGRPVDLEWLPDGSLLVSDDVANAVYRIYYTG